MAVQFSVNSVKHGWANNLKRLRSVGSRRLKPSTAYAALKGKLSRGQILLDIGCGDSSDRVIATRRGLTAYGIDIYAPLNQSLNGLICADARRLPFGPATVDAVICQAMVSLVPPDDRYGFYGEVARVLKPRGWFSVVFYTLTDGWIVKPEFERQRIAATDSFQRVSSGLYQRRF